MKSTLSFSAVEFQMVLHFMEKVDYIFSSLKAGKSEASVAIWRIVTTRMKNKTVSTY